MNGAKGFTLIEIVLALVLILIQYFMIDILMAVNTK